MKSEVTSKARLTGLHVATASSIPVSSYWSKETPSARCCCTFWGRVWCSLTNVMFTTFFTKAAASSGLYWHLHSWMDRESLAQPRDCCSQVKKILMFGYMALVRVVLLCHQALVVLYIFKCLTGQATATNKQWMSIKCSVVLLWKNSSLTLTRYIHGCWSPGRSPPAVVLTDQTVVCRWINTLVIMTMAWQR